MPFRNLHPVLARQLRREGIHHPHHPPNLDAWWNLVKHVSASYKEAESDRYLLERSLDLSSKEMQEQSASFAEERNRFRGMLSAISDGICSLDRHGRVTWANPAAARILSTGEGRLGGFPFLDHLSDLTAEQNSAPHPEAPADGVHKRGTLRCPSGDVPVSYILNEVGADGTWVIVFRDITQELAAERELRNAREAADHASRAKSQFLANMSHEIRTPMNGVIGVVELLLQTRLDEEQANYANLIQRSGEALLAIINDVLDLSKIEAGKVTLHPEDFPVHRTVETVVESFAPAGRLKGVDVSLFIHPAVPPLAHGDQGKIRQVLSNLVSNSVKFTDSGTVFVSVKPVTPELGAPLLRFEVCDSGIGIDAEAQARLFRPFSQVDDSNTRRHTGTGLGLAICKHFVEMMDGRIWVESITGAGSRFTFEVPLVEPKDPSKAAAPPILDLAQRKVLLLLHNPLEAQGMAVWIRHWNGCPEPVEVRNLQNSLDGRANTLLIADFHITGGSWRFSPAVFRSFLGGRNNGLIVIAAPKLRRAVFHSIGDFGFLPKPVLLAQLAGRLNDASREAAVRAAPPAAEPTPPEIATLARQVLANGAAVARPQILVAEDSPVNQVVVTSMLKRLGFTVDVCTNGQSAVEMALKTQYSAILMDCQMPVLDGFEATAQIRNLERALAEPRRTPIIALTANALSGDREKCLAAGMDDHIPKPLQMRLLQESLAARIPASLPAVQ